MIWRHFASRNGSCAFKQDMVDIQTAACSALITLFIVSRQCTCADTNSMKSCKSWWTAVPAVISCGQHHKWTSLHVTFRRKGRLISSRHISLFPFSMCGLLASLHASFNVIMRPWWGTLQYGRLPKSSKLMGKTCVDQVIGKSQPLSEICISYFNVASRRSSQDFPKIKSSEVPSENWSKVQC